jgi:putative flavoprotein involved in K+ transport
VQLDGSAAANVAAGEEMAVRVRTMVDTYIEQSGTDAPRADPDPDDAPVTVRSYDQIDLHAAGVSTVLWCTGFGGDFGWMPESWTHEGLPVTDGVRGAVDGLWFVGLRWLTRRGSSILYGFPRDAAVVADDVVRSLAAA